MNIPEGYQDSTGFHYGRPVDEGRAEFEAFLDSLSPRQCVTRERVRQIKGRLGRLYRYYKATRRGEAAAREFSISSLIHIPASERRGCPAAGTVSNAGIQVFRRPGDGSVRSGSFPTSL